MDDPEFDEATVREKLRARRSPWPGIFGVAFVVYSGWWFIGCPGCSRAPYTCAVCRLERKDQQVFGLRWSYMEETECSRWYRIHVEPTHQHAWIQRGHCQRFGIPGLFGGYGCVIGGPLTGLSYTVQINIYQHFKDPLEAKILFVRLAQRPWDPERHRIWIALMKWVDEGNPGTWSGWWEKHCADVDESLP